MKEVLDTLHPDVSGNIIVTFLLENWFYSLIFAILATGGVILNQAFSIDVSMLMDLWNRIQQRMRQNRRIANRDRAESSANSPLRNRRSFLVTICVGIIGLAGVRRYFSRPAYSITGQFNADATHHNTIKIACFREGEATVRSTQADDSGFFSLPDIEAGKYYIFVYCLNELTKVSEWSQLERDVEDQNLAIPAVKFPRHIGTFTAFPLIRFSSGGHSIDDEADRALASIKTALDNVPGTIVIEGRTSDAAGVGGKYDNFNLACSRCVAVAAELNSILHGRDVIHMPLATKSPLSRPGTTPDAQEERSVRIIVMSADTV